MSSSAHRLGQSSGWPRPQKKKQGPGLFRQAAHVFWLLLCLSVVGVPSRARGEPPEVDWSLTFSPASLAPYVEEGRSRILVVAAASDPQTGRVSLVIQTALRASGKAEEVLDGERLGALDLLDDQGIVQKAAHLPVSSIAIVRLQAAQANPAVRVNFYTPQGELRRMIHARAGEPLSLPSSEFASSTAIAVPASTTSALRLAQAEYDDKYLGFIGIGPAENNIQNTTLRSLTAYEGRAQRRLSPTDFYQKLRLPNLAESYEQRRNYAVNLLTVGGVQGGLSLVASIASAIDRSVAVSHQDPMSISSTTDRFVAISIGSTLLLISAVATVVVGGVKYLDRHPIPSGEALRLAEQYNRSLRRRLGLQAATVSFLQGVNLQVSESGVGISKRGRF